MIFAGTDLRKFLRFVFCRIREKSDVEIDAVPRVFFSVHRVARVQNADGHTAHHTQPINFICICIVLVLRSTLICVLTVITVVRLITLNILSVFFFISIRF